MGRTLAFRMIIAHPIGLFVATLITTLTSPDPQADELIMFFIIGYVFSLIFFVPAVILAALNSMSIFRRPSPFLVLGPIVVTILSVGLLGSMWTLAAISTVVSSLVLYATIRLDNPVDYVVED